LLTPQDCLPSTAPACVYGLHTCKLHAILIEEKIIAKLEKKINIIGRYKRILQEHPTV